MKRKYFNKIQVPIGRTSRATFGFPAKRVNITIIISYSRRKFVLRNVIVQTVFRIVSAVKILKTISGIEWDIL